jgi:hypothetical protein
MVGYIVLEFTHITLMQKKNCTIFLKFNYIHIFHHLLEGVGFFCQFFLLQYLKIVKVCKSYI